MSAPVFPGTNRRFRPSFLMTPSGGATIASIRKDWNKRVAPYYKDWIDTASNTGVGIFMPRITFRDLCPARGRYRWDRIEQVLDMPAFQDPYVSFHWRIGAEGTMPRWFPRSWYATRGSKPSVNVLNGDFVKWLLNDFLPAYADKYDNDERVFTFAWDETSTPDGVSPTRFGNALIDDIVNKLPDIIERQMVFKFHTFNHFKSDRIDRRVGIALADPKVSMSGITGNFPDSNIGWGQGEANDVSAVLKSPRKGYRRAFMIGSEPNGWRITGSANIPNPWGGRFPNNAPKLSCARGIHPQSWIWVHSGKPRNKSSNHPAGLAPASYLYFPAHNGNDNMPNNHTCENDKMWDEAFSKFGGSGTRAAPSVPWGWKGDSPPPPPPPPPVDDCEEKLRRCKEKLLDTENALDSALDKIEFYSNKLLRIQAILDEQ